MKKTCGKAAFYVAIIVICLIMVTPVYLLAKVSFSVKSEILTQHPTLLIHQFTWEHWLNVFRSGNLWAPLKKSLIVSCLTTLGSLVIVVPASYVVSRMSKKKRYAFVLGLFFTRMIPSVAIALPISVTFLKMDLIDTSLGLVLANMITQIPFMAWILVSTFAEVPVALDEAAWIDGASRLQAIVKVILPVSMQLSNNSKTLPLQIYYYVSRGNVFERAAYSTILAIPVILVTFVLQRYLKPDYLGGSVKG